MPAKSTKGFCLLLVHLLTLFFLPQILLAREIVIGDTLKVELVNNKMSNEGAQRIFNYTKSTLYGHKKYKEAIEAFKTIVDYSDPNAKDVDIGLFGKSFYSKNSDLRDDALYYIGKCYYNMGYRIDYVESFEQLYHLFPNGSVVKSGQLQNTLLNILENEQVGRFYYIMRVYHFLARAFPSETAVARKIVINRAGEDVAISTCGSFISEGLPVHYSLKRSYRLAVKECGGWENESCVKDRVRDRHSEQFAKKVWGYFDTGLSLEYEQEKAVTQFVRKSLSFDPYPCKTYYSQVEGDCAISVRTCLRDLLKLTGIDLFNIGKTTKDYI